MKKIFVRIFSLLLLCALVVSPVAATPPQRPQPVSDPPVFSEEELIWLESAQNAESFTVQLQEPSLALHTAENSIDIYQEGPQGNASVFNSTEAVAYLQHLNVGMDAFISEAEALLGRPLEVLYRYDYVINGFSVRMSVEEAALLRQHPSVREIYVNSVSQIQTDTSPGFIGAEQLWSGDNVPSGVGKRGEGTRIGIIDTGINLNHPSFSDSIFGYTYPAPPGGYLGLCKTDPGNHPCNNKVIGMYDFLDGTNGFDTDNHGSHVAGIAAGNQSQATYLGSTLNISGIAPRAQIISYKVCGAYGCPDSAQTAAINQAVADQVNVINISLNPTSSPPRNPWANAIDIALLEAFKAGIITATSAGNSGPNASTIYQLAPWAIVTGNTSHGRIFGYSVTVAAGDSVTENYTALPASEDLSPALATDLNNVDLILGSSVSNAEGCQAWAAGSLTGKVALVRRGGCNFYTKILNIKNAGGLFALVANNADGPLVIMGSESGSAGLPSGMISKKAGDRIQMLQNLGFTLKVTIPKNISRGTRSDWGDILANTTSRGPITNFDILEPDLVAPGIDVLSAYSTGSTVDLMTGTSIASPQVAGAAAVLRSLFPSRSPSAIRSALIMTALADTTVNQTGNPVTPFDYGNGRIDLTKAALAGLVMEENYIQYKLADPDNGGDPRELNIPSYQNSACIGSCTFKRKVLNVSGVSTTYTIDIEKDDGVEITTSPSGSFTIPAGSSREITVTITPAMDNAENWDFARISLNTENTFPNGKPISNVALTMAFKNKVNGSNVPETLRRQISAPSGQTIIKDVAFTEAITNFNTTRYGLEPALVHSFTLAEDPTRGDPYDDLSDVWYTTINCQGNSPRLVVEVLETTAKDLDIYVGIGSIPSESSLRAYAFGDSAKAYLNIHKPTFSGTCWVMIQNYESSGQPDTVKVAISSLSPVDRGNLTITAPATVPKLQPFDVTLNWNLNSTEFAAREVWYGRVFLNSSATAEPGDIGKMDVNLYKLPLGETLYLPVLHR